MTQYLKDLVKIDNQDDLYEEIEIERVRLFRARNLLELHLHTPNVLSFDSYQEIHHKLKELTGSNIQLFIQPEQNRCNQVEIRKYLDVFFHTNPEMRILESGTFQYDAQKCIIKYAFVSATDCDRASSYIEHVESFLATIGLHGVTVLAETLIPVMQNEIKEVSVTVVSEEAERPQEKSTHKYQRTKMDDYEKINLIDVHDPIADIQFEGEVFGNDYIEIRKTGRTIQSFSVFDGTDAIAVKRFEGRGATKEDLSSIHDGDYVRIYGTISYDSFAKDLTCIASNVVKIEKAKIVDTAETKRVELHMHSNLSEMDGVCDIKDIITYVYNLGHRGIAITDHADVQSLVKAYNTAQSLKKKDPDREFRVGLGCEFNLANDELTIVRNATDENLDDVTYISFDLETTGLSCYFDHIIEFGAVRIKNSTIIDRKQLFIKPPVSIPGFITSKTNITNDMVKNAKPFAEAIDEILDYIKDDVLVAHNATFDYYFLNEELRRIGRKPLTNVVIDTLDMSRAVLPDRRAYRLGNLSRYYHVNYNEEEAHRADFDAGALADVFLCLLKDAKDKFAAKTISDLQIKLQSPKSFMKVRRSHVCAIAKNHDGLVALYKLVTESNTNTLAVNGKATGKEGTDVAAEPRVVRSTLEKYRENLLLGSACLNGEVFELACNGDDARLEEAMKLYDYIELQPLGNYSTSIVLGSIPSVDRLKEVQKRILRMAQKLNIPVCATSDAHYCIPEQKIFRDVYIMSQGVGGTIHPLYIRDEVLRLRTKNPDQHIRLTDEMKKEFAWLDDPDLIEEIVVRNPNSIFDLIEEIRPVPAGTYPPVIEGSDDKLRKICHDTAMRMYGFEGKVPEIVTDRLNSELDNIIRNGFGVHYYIAHLLVKKSNDDGYVVGSRGSVGSSFTATMSGITEVNPLRPHYLCPKCHYSEFFDDPSIASGFDLPDKVCPYCGETMRGNGHNIPFQTFLGFNADKTPDIDLNFSNEYQWRAHAFIKDVFGEDHAFRAGTIGTVAEKTAFGYVQGYCEKMKISNMRRPMKDYLAHGCQNVKRTTGQHPGGIIIIPHEYEAEDFTPVQYPANDPTSAWKTTHYDFHDIHDNVLKFDILGHVDPTAMRLLQKIATVKPLDIPMNDIETLSLFSCDDALKADTRIYKKETGALGLPEFGTRTTRGVLEETRPKKFSDLVIISGLSHGTDVWAGNAQELIRQGHTIDEVIGCRDDIMTYLLDHNLESLDAFKIMESVRKGKGLTEAWEKSMIEHQVPEWYIESCKKIKYMFPKAHAVAYVMMAMRIAWYKVHEPLNFYIQYLTLRCDTYEIETMAKGIDVIRTRMNDISTRIAERNPENPVSNKEKSLFDVLEVCEELYARGYNISNVDLYKSLATEFRMSPDNPKTIIPPFTVIDGLGVNVAKSIEEAREKGEFLSKEDILKRTQVSSSMLVKLAHMGCLEGLQESNQMSLF
ncbi:PolC-type DNA polymerase III [Solobacterium moorei]|uniref:PolC-type DNA polymerase III n=1 Tax=Solobacterium moorei TaxID=102148 RepID=UPI0023F26C69|nr:PolC-type DNA polymerase III [Solobacterium moorei]